MTALSFTAAGAIGLVAKTTLVLSVALVLARFARRGSAKTLHLLWTTTFAVLLMLPVMSLLAPAWVLPILPARTAAIEHHLPDKTADEPSAMANSPSAARPPQPAASLPPGYLPPPSRANGSIPLTPAAGVFLIWALGCAAGLVSLGAAALRFRKLVRGATPIRDPDWMRSTDMLRHRARVRAEARILSSAEVSTPMTGGSLRPVILLPASAKHWTSGRREMVVSHELVHVRRRDALWRLVAGVVVAVYWFHPLIWLASRLAAAARERSCDEEVLALGVRPSAYARDLFALASEIAPGPSVLSLPVVQHPHLESRIMSILRPHRPRFSRIRTYAALAVVGVVGTAAACATPVRMGPAASPAPQARTARVPEVPVENPAPPGNRPRASSSSSDRTREEPAPAGPVAAAPAMPEVLGLQETECKPGSFTGIMKNRESTTVQVSVDGMSLCMYTSGDVALTGDGTAVASMDPGSRLVLRSQAESLHWMAMTSGPSGFEYEWSIDGRSQPFNDEARDWRDLMLTVLARSQEAWEVRGKEAGMQREIGSYERHVAGLRREIASHEREVASLRREIASHERHVASLHREIGGYERKIAGLRRGIARMTSAGAEEALWAMTRALERLDSQELGAVAQALAEEFGEVRLRALGEDARQIVEDALRLRGEAQNEVVRQLAYMQVEMVRAEDELRSARQAIAEYDLDRRVDEIIREIERYDLDGKVRDIEARIEQYDLDGRIREIEARIEEWDADRRAGAIERSVQDDVATLRHLIDATGRQR
ncbi:MAG: hypothetical protein OXP36_07265 [Gammaproteobacteria bacterium]|nr:hypothetical protein [Gammaproteobacteria bacterium]